jgi:pSer/pThr/pTyr-binding forkhead associated (FHA) protein
MEDIHSPVRNKVDPIVDQLNAQKFLQACGARTPLQLDVEHRPHRQIESRILPLPFALIGRDERADLRLDDMDVSGRHAYLQMVAGRWWWMDLDSREGTLNAGEASTAMPLLDRHGIRIGPFTIRPGGEGSADETGSANPLNPLSSDADDPLSLPRLALEFCSGTTRRRTWIVDRPLMLVGRASFCKVHLQSPRVSRTHCALVNTPTGLWVVDLLSREGTSVNGTAVRWARLVQDDELRIDPFLIRVRYLAPPMRPIAAKTQAHLTATERGLIPIESGKGELVRPSLRLQTCPSAADSPAQALVSSESTLPVNAIESMLLPVMAQFSLMQQQMFEQFQQTVLMMGEMFGNLQQEQIALVRQELDQIQRLTQELQTLQKESPRPTHSPRPEPLPFPRETEAKAPVKPAAATVDTASAAAPAAAEIHTWLSQRLTAIHQERQNRWQKILGVLTGK